MRVHANQFSLFKTVAEYLFSIVTIFCVFQGLVRSLFAQGQELKGSSLLITNIYNYCYFV